MMDEQHYQNCYDQGRSDYLTRLELSDYTAWFPPYVKSTLEYMFWKAGWESMKEEMGPKVG